VKDGTSQKMSILPSKAASLIQVVLGFGFLVFGAVLIFPRAADVSESELGLLLTIFGVIWVIACGAIIGYGVYCLSKRKPVGLYTIEVETVDPTSGERGSVASADFDSRLRKLESLKREGLITDDEYNRKRAEIMTTKW
jgi:hypothetical protein